MLIDQQHVVTELYAISNVPTVIWVDENDRIVRPNGVAFGTDTVTAFTGIESKPHLDLIRRWVNDGVEPETGHVEVDDLSDDEVLARLHFRIAAHARRNGDEHTAATHFERAGQLAPHDWTIRRAALPLTGDDPFGATFFVMYEEWQAAGRPYHGIPGEHAGE
jgi:hypothetical protein